MKTVDHMLVMDVDGVICNLKEKKANPKVIQHIHQQLINDMPLALNTGRSLDDVIEDVINPLIKNHIDKSFLIPPKTQ